MNVPAPLKQAIMLLVAHWYEHRELVEGRRCADTAAGGRRNPRQALPEGTAVMAITIGSLRHRLKLQAPQDTGDTGGGAERTWQDVATVWGSIRPLFGREGYVHEKFSGRITHEIVLRYRAGVVPNMRLVLSTRIFEIHARLDEGSRGRWLICHCEELDL